MTITIVGDAPGSDVEIAPPAVSVFSLAFNGTNERMNEPVAKDIGAADAWSIMGWIKYDLVTASTFDILYLLEGALGGNRITVKTKTPILAQVAGRVQIAANLPGGFEFKDLEWWDVIPDDEWVQFVFTYDGALGGDPVTLYIDGVDQGVADAIGKDNVGNQDNTLVRTVDIGGTSGGGEWPGINNQIAMWSNALTSAEVTELFNSGSGINLLSSGGNYVSNATLLHWWQLGRDIAIGEDTGNHTTLIDLTGVNMDVSNRIADHPEL